MNVKNGRREWDGEGISQTGAISLLDRQQHARLHKKVAVDFDKRKTLRS